MIKANRIEVAEDSLELYAIYCHRPRGKKIQGFQCCGGTGKGTVVLWYYVKDNIQVSFESCDESSFPSVKGSLISFDKCSFITIKRQETKEVTLIESKWNSSAKGVDFLTDTCKTVLLNPRNRLAEFCLNLKVNVDDYYPGTCFRCSYCGRSCDYSQVKCPCGQIFDKQAFLTPPHSTDDYRGAFIQGKMTFIITDDLSVKTNSPSSLVQLFGNLGFNDVNQITELSVQAGLLEISSLLKYSLISKSPLTDVFLQKKGKINNTSLPEPGYVPPSLSGVQEDSTGKLSLKIILRKSTNRILFAEADNDFVDFLFSFFILPIGSVVKLLDGNSGLGCVDNLFRNVTCLNSEWLTLSPDNLLDAGVKSQYKCLKQLLQIRYHETSGYFVDPRYHPGQEKFSGRFVKTPSLFILSDNLKVIPLSSASSIGFLKEFNVPVSDIKEQEIMVSEAEALCILKASLTSSAALTDGLNSLL